MEDIIKSIEDIGGRFVLDPGEFQSKLSSSKAFIFDWDGVFNDGVKTSEYGSPFSEVDSMGINLLRFGWWLKNGEFPPIAIITGQRNEIATHLAKREHFEAVYFKVIDKRMALKHFCADHSIQPNEIAFLFDDILDLGLAGLCGLRFLVNRTGTPLFAKYVENNRLCDYISANQGNNFAVREICEMILGISGLFEKVTYNRKEVSPDYRQYWNLRNQRQSTVYTVEQEMIIPWDDPK